KPSSRAGSNSRAAQGWAAALVCWRAPTSTPTLPGQTRDPAPVELRLSPFAFGFCQGANSHPHPGTGSTLRAPIQAIGCGSGFLLGLVQFPSEYGYRTA